MEMVYEMGIIVLDTHKNHRLVTIKHLIWLKGSKI